MRYMKFEVCFLTFQRHKIWHEGLIFKLMQNGISGKLLCLIKYFLSDREQHVVLDNASLGWMSKQEFLKVLYLDYINDLSNNLTSNIKLFTDDTSLFSTVTDPDATGNRINNDLHNINS